VGIGFAGVGFGSALAVVVVLAGCAARAPESRPAPPPAPYAPRSPPVGAAKVIAQPQPIDVAIPSSEYPQQALAADVQGFVVLKLLLDETGRVREAKVLKDPGWGFGEAAMRSAIAHFRFSPARVNGQPVSSWWRFTVFYVLPRR
jgi:periplasmic protein TonB